VRAVAAMRQFRPEAVRDAVTVREAQAAKRAELAAAADAAEPDHTMIIGTQESRESTRVALEIIRDLAASCYGPSGRPKLIRANESGGAVTVTSTSHRLFGAMRLQHPAARVLLELLSARQAHGADGGHFTLMLSTELVLRMHNSRVPPRLATALLQEALEVCGRFLHEPDCACAPRLRVGSLPSLLGLVRAVVAPKRVALPGVDADGLQRLCVLLVDAFVRSLPDDEAGLRADACDADNADDGPIRLLPGIRQLALVGAPCTDSEIVDGVLLDVPLADGAPLPKPGSPLHVALYAESLEAGADLVGDAAIQLGGAAAAAAEATLARFADALAAAGVRLLACQKLVAPALQRLLLARGIIPLPRLSLRHVGAVRRLSGAVLGSGLGVPPADALGRLGGAAMRRLGGRDYLHLLPPPAALPDGSWRRRAQPVLTLVLWAPQRSAADELAAAATCALQTLGAALTQAAPAVVPGGGAVECVLAAELRRRAAALPAGDGGAADKTLRRQRRAAWLILAEALEAAVAALAEGGAGGKAAVEAVHEANAGGNGAFYGWDAKERKPREVLSVREGEAEEARVVELRHAKLEAVAAAVEAASALAGVDQILLDVR